MEDKKKHPSVPANYVTLVQLQERWLKEKERKEKEKQQRERREEEVKPKLADQKDSVGKQARPSNASKHRKSTASGSRRDEPGALAWKVVEEVVAVDGDKKDDQQGQSPASKNKKKRRQPRRQNPNPTAVKDVGHKEGVEHAPPEGGATEDSRERRSEESRGIRANGSDLDRTAEVETKFRDLSVNGAAEKRKSKSKRAGEFHHHRGSREFRGYGAERFGGRRWKPRDGLVVWVKKGEPFDGNAGRMQKLEGTGALPEL